MHINRSSLFTWLCIYSQAAVVFPSVYITSSHNTKPSLSIQLSPEILLREAKLTCFLRASS